MGPGEESFTAIAIRIKKGDARAMEVRATERLRALRAPSPTVRIGCARIDPVTGGSRNTGSAVHLTTGDIQFWIIFGPVLKRGSLFLEGCTV